MGVKHVRHAANRYRRFPLYSTWGGAFNTVGTQLPPLLFAALFSPAFAGIYMLAHRVLAMPMQLLGKAIADVFFSNAAEAYRNGGLDELVTGIHSKLTHIAMPPVLILILVGSDIFAFIFGESWRQAGIFAQWLAPFIYIQFVTSPLSALHSVIEKQAQGVIFHGILLTVRACALIVGSMEQDIILTVGLFALGSALCWVGFLFWIISLSGAPPVQTVAVMSARAVGYSVFIVFPIFVTIIFGATGGVLVISFLFSIVIMISRYYKILRAAY